MHMKFKIQHYNDSCKFLSFKYTKLLTSYYISISKLGFCLYTQIQENWIQNDGTDVNL